MHVETLQVSWQLCQFYWKSGFEVVQGYQLTKETFASFSLLFGPVTLSFPEQTCTHTTRVESKGTRPEK